MKFALLLLSFFYFQCSYAATTTGMVIGPTIAKDQNHHLEITDPPVKIITLNCIFEELCEGDLTSIQCPEALVKKILWRNPIKNSLILCFKKE